MLILYNTNLFWGWILLKLSTAHYFLGVDIAFIKADSYGVKSGSQSKSYLAQI